MNYRLVAHQLGIVAILIGGAMLASLFWAWDGLSLRPVEASGFFGLLAAMGGSVVVGAVLIRVSGRREGKFYRKEAMAIVGLSWILATFLGALPFWLSRTEAKAGVQMSFVDCLFESQSGFSTTGATVLTDIESPELVPRCILFWRSTTQFLGGLGIMVLFVAMLGQGSAGKALMRNEMPGPSKEGPQARMQHTAWVLVLIYSSLNLLLTLLLRLEGLSWFDALCHAFCTMATGGFSTYNASVAHFSTQPGLNGPLIEMTLLVFMVLAGTNFMLLYFSLLGHPRRLFRDVEWLTYMAVMVGVTVAIAGFGLYNHDFKTPVARETTGASQSDTIVNTDTNTATLVSNAGAESREEATPEETSYATRWSRETGRALRFASFQVVSLMTTTGYCSADFDQWSGFSRGILFLLMFVGGCAGSTGGGLKVIRHILFHKILWLEVERSFRPSVVRPLRLGGEPLPDQDLRRNILVYFGLILVIFVASWMTLVTIEPDATWQRDQIQNKLIDSATGVAATLNNIGPGLGTIGATRNYAHFSPPAKLLFTLLMMLGRLELFAILVLFVPGFWRSQ